MYTLNKKMCAEKLTHLALHIKIRPQGKEKVTIAVPKCCFRAQITQFSKTRFQVDRLKKILISDKTLQNLSRLASPVCLVCWYLDGKCSLL